MRNELNQIERIENFLLGLLTPKEVRDFRTEMVIEPKLRAAVDQHSRILGATDRFVLKSVTDIAFKRWRYKNWIIKGGLGVVTFFAAIAAYVLLSGAPVKEVQAPQVLPDSESNGPVEIATQEKLPNPSEDPIRKIASLHSETHKKGQEGNANILVGKIEDSQVEMKSPLDGNTREILDDIMLKDTCESILEWRLDNRTTKDELNKIKTEILENHGRLEIRRSSWNENALASIEFKVINNFGYVNYVSGKLSPENVVCIRFPENGIQVRNCEQTDFNLPESIDLNTPELEMELLSVDRPLKKKRFFKGDRKRFFHGKRKIFKP